MVVVVCCEILDGGGNGCCCCCCCEILDGGAFIANCSRDVGVETF